MKMTVRTKIGHKFFLPSFVSHHEFFEGTVSNSTIFLIVQYIFKKDSNFESFSMRSFKIESLNDLRNYC